MINSYVMKAPYNKPTEKTEKRLASKQISIGSNTQVVAVNLNDVLSKITKDKDLQNYIRNEATKRIDSEESVESIKVILSEYFNSFIVLGYGVDGERIIIKDTRTDRDSDSILEMLRYVIVRMIQE